MRSSPRLCAVVPTYEPGPSLARLVDRLIAQGMTVIVVDDGSTTPPQGLPAPVEMINGGRNRGIAACLNAGLERAQRLGATHVLTLDQDSLVAADFLAEISRLWQGASEQGLRPGVLAPADVAGISYRGKRAGAFLRVPEVMQSGALFGVDALREAGGFDESLVIDCVDTDACLRLRECGYDVLVGPLRIEHQLGRVRVINLLGRQLLLTRHPAFRDYYMARNRLLVARRHGRREPRWAFSMLRRALVAAVLTLAFDRPVAAKAAAIGRGWLDGLRGRSGPLPADVRKRWNTGCADGEAPAADGHRQGSTR